MRNDFSRSQTQSTEDVDLMEADPLFHYDNARWIDLLKAEEFRRYVARPELLRQEHGFFRTSAALERMIAHRIGGSQGCDNKSSQQKSQKGM